ncbi:hypothetical protein LJC39_01840 [Parabacteroides sp. OttesenSCG-928-B22]|nr:hypothetical protein [Parabacteroides sp. OttesenSCG-928-B22]
MSETLITILQWLVPAGGLGAAFGWLTSKTLRNLRTAKEMHDTYKVMYEDTQGTLKEIQDEKKELRKIVSRFERAVARCYSCRYHDICPVLYELQKHKGDLNARAEGFTPLQRKTNRHARDNPDGPGDTSDSDTEPAGIA